MLLFVAGLRSFDIGTDTRHYSDIFIYIKEGLNTDYIEVGWRFLNRTVGFLGMNYTVVIFIAEFLCLYPVFYVLKRTVENYNFGVFIYYAMYLYLHSFNMVRQCIAMSLCLLSYYNFIKKNTIKTIIWFLIAYSFHKSALIFLILYPLKFVNINAVFTVFLLVSTFAFGLIFTNKIIFFVAGNYVHYLQNSDFGFRDRKSTRLNSSHRL